MLTVAEPLTEERCEGGTVFIFMTAEFLSGSVESLWVHYLPFPICPQMAWDQQLLT